MTKYALMLAAAGLLVAAPTVVKAEEHAADHAAPAAAEATAAKEVTLEDGTKVSVEGDMVSVVAADGTKTPAPDGEHKDTEGHVWTVKDGKLVK
jgi:ketosteroid isomerase-like protein